jgi:hypothetical protein
VVKKILFNAESPPVSSKPFALIVKIIGIYSFI